MTRRPYRISAALVVALFFFPGLASSSIKHDENVCLIAAFDSCIDKNSSLPCGWRATRRDVSMYSLQKEAGNYFVKIRTRSGCTAIGKRLYARPAETPYLHWRWRAHVLPKGGKENDKKRADSGAGVYVVFKGPLRMNAIIKYVWSSTLPQGTVTPSPYYFRAKIVVLESGEASLGTWVPEVVNVNDDYKRVFAAAPPAIIAIGIMSDADNTDSFAEADYGDFYLERTR